MNSQPDEVLFEFRRVGRVVKVSALDVTTNTEVCIVGAANAGEYALKMAVLRRLRYVLDHDRQKER